MKTQPALIGAGDPDGRPYQLRRDRRRGPVLDERLDVDDPDRGLVDKARALFETGQFRSALKLLELPAVEVAWRAGVSKATLSHYANGKQEMPYTLKSVRLARVVIGLCERADAKAAKGHAQ